MSPTEQALADMATAITGLQTALQALKDALAVPPPPPPPPPPAPLDDGSSAAVNP